MMKTRFLALTLAATLPLAACGGSTDAVAVQNDAGIDDTAIGNETLFDNASDPALGNDVLINETEETNLTATDNL